MWRGLGKGKKRGNNVIFKLYICFKKKKKKGAPAKCGSKEAEAGKSVNSSSRTAWSTK